MKIHGALPKTEHEVVRARLAELAEAFARFSDTLHKFDGTQSGAPFGSRDMAVAYTHLQTAWLWAREAVEKS